MNQFSTSISEVLSFGKEEAERLASTSVGPEHLLLGILRQKDSAVKDFFKSHQVNLAGIKYELEERIRQQNSGRLLFASDMLLNDKASNILRLAVLEARIQHTSVVDVNHLFLAMLHDNTDNGAKDVLEANNLDYQSALEVLGQPKNTTPKSGIGIPDEDEEDEEMATSSSGSRQQQASATAQRTKKGDSKTPVLDNFSTDLTKAAAEGKLDPVVGREREIVRLSEILGRRKKNNPVLIGEPGVGKSAIVEGLAQLIVKRHTAPTLFNKRLVNLDMTAIVAGTKYRGQFEERLRMLIKELEQNPDIIIFIDEIHTIIGAGSTPGSMDAANILKPALARGTIQCIGATTLDEYRNSIEKDGALERRFQKVLVEPTNTVETLQILENIKDRYEQHHHVAYTDDAITACVKLTERYVTDRSFPDKAIDALDEVGARVHLQHAQVPPEINEKEKEIELVKQKKDAAVKSQDFELAANYRDRQTQLEAELQRLNEQWSNGEAGTRETVTEKEVADVVSMMTGVPVQRMAEAEGIRLRNMAERLKGAVIAQDEAIEKMVKAIQRNRVGLKEPNHPIGVFMFLGPTGVGKTYLAKKLAEEMFGSEDDLIRIDMSEFTESFNVSRLVGAPPGYVGYEEGGQLTEKVRRKPYSIVLLDEIEKAHPDVFNLLLQVLDDGQLTDSLGRKVDFKNTIIIMTSNIGSRQLKDFGMGVGFGTQAKLNSKNEYSQSVIDNALKRTFAPEFLNRVDDVVMFNSLDKNDIHKIIGIEIRQVVKRVEEMGYKIELTEKAMDFIAEKGWDEQYGARPLKRAVQKYVEDVLAEAIISSGLHIGDTISIDLSENGEETVVNVIPNERKILEEAPVA